MKGANKAPFFVSKYLSYLGNFTAQFGRFVVLAPGHALPLSLKVLVFSLPHD